MKVGDYVRTKDGIIGKAIIVTEYCVNIEDKFIRDINDVIKSSPNIIDLIEVGDWVNGDRVFRWYDGDLVLFDSGYSILKEIKITSIVTHEQFSQIEYKVGE